MTKNPLRVCMTGRFYRSKTVGSWLFIRLMFKAGRQYPKECRQTRPDINQKLSQAVTEWGKERLYDGKRKLSSQDRWVSWRVFRPAQERYSGKK